jgi:hypothetical protein
MAPNLSDLLIRPEITGNFCGREFPVFLSVVTIGLQKRLGESLALLFERWSVG